MRLIGLDEQREDEEWFLTRKSEAKMTVKTEDDDDDDDVGWCLDPAARMRR